MVTQRHRQHRLEVCHALSRYVQSDVAGTLNRRSKRDFTLATGLAGNALGLVTVGVAIDDDELTEHGMSALAEAVRALSRAPATLGLFVGASGVGWVVRDLARLLPERVPVDSLDDLDALIVEYLTLTDDRLHDSFDLISGLVGIGVYSLGRFHDGREDVLELVVKKLCDTQIANRGAGTWLTRPWTMPLHFAKQFPHGVFDLGLAHGVPGCIAFLTHANNLLERDSKLDATIESACAWLQSVSSSTETAEATFPHYLDVDGTPISHPSRVGWCYGDLSCALAFAYAARTQAGHRANAKRLVKKVLRRRRALYHVVDDGLCHGAAGVGYLLRALGQELGLAAAERQGDLWLNRVADKAGRAEVDEGTAPNITAAYAGHTDSGTLTRTVVPGFLEGVSGVALALLDGERPTSSNWAECLLIRSAGASEGASPPRTTRT